MRVDYHFHPNLQGKHSPHRLKAMWKAIEKHRLDAIICTEHTFKNAPRAYRRLAGSKPAHLRTHVFPGAELVTSDGSGIDVIAFAEHDWYDQHPRLLEPFSMQLHQMLAYLEASDLSYFIPHPNLLTNPLKRMYETEEDMHYFLSSVPGIEVFNGCFVALERACRLPVLRSRTRNFRTKLQSSAYLCIDNLSSHRAEFLAVGSDAHHPSEVGVCVDISCENADDRCAAFHSLRTNRDVSRISIPTSMRSVFNLPLMGLTTLGEGGMRRGWKMYRKLQERLGEEHDDFLLPKPTPEAVSYAESRGLRITEEEE